MSELILNNFALHIALAPAEQEQVLSFWQKRVVHKRAVLLPSGDVGKYLYFVNSGSLRMFYTDNAGLEHNICFYPENCGQ